MAVERVRGGEVPSSVIASFGFNRTTIYRWLEVASKPGMGLSALRSRPATGRPRSLTSRQEQQVFRWINGCDPRQYGLDFGLWTRSLVAELIERKFHIRLGVTAVGALLAKLGLTPQKPLQRAYQRDPAAIEKWQREQFPAIARQAKASGGEVYFWDESGFRAGSSGPRLDTSCRSHDGADFIHHDLIRAARRGAGDRGRQWAACLCSPELSQSSSAIDRDARRSVKQRAATAMKFVDMSLRFALTLSRPPRVMAGTRRRFSNGSRLIHGARGADGARA